MKKAVRFILPYRWQTRKEGLILLVTCKFLDNQWPNIYTDNPDILDKDLATVV